MPPTARLVWFARHLAGRRARPAPAKWLRRAASAASSTSHTDRARRYIGRIARRPTTLQESGKPASAPVGGAPRPSPPAVPASAPGLLGRDLHRRRREPLQCLQRIVELIVLDALLLELCESHQE